MENLDNIFSLPSTTTTTNNDHHDTTNWLLQNQDDIFGYLNNTSLLLQNNSNDNIGQQQTNITNTSTSSSSNNCKEQQLLLDIQQQKQQQQIQMQQQIQQLENYQIQQQQVFQQFQQQINNNNNNTITPTQVSFNFEPPILEHQQQQQQNSISMKPSSTLQTTSLNSNSSNYNDSQYIPLLNFNNNNFSINDSIQNITTTTTPIINTNTTTTTTNTTKNSNKIIIDKEEKKKINNRYYHKKFREKKKDQIKEIENQIAALTFENEQLKKDNESIKKDGESVESFLPTKEGLDLFESTYDYVVKMKDALENNDDISLMYHLQRYQSTFTQVYTLNHIDIERIFHPNFQLIFAMLGYAPDSDRVIYDILIGVDSDLWLEQFKKESGMNDDQSIKFDELRFKLGRADKQHLKERIELDTQVKKFLLDYIYMLPIDPLSTIDDQGDEIQLTSPFDFSKTKLATCKPLNYGQCLEIVFKMENLKNKVFSGRILMMDFYCSLCTILTPRQEAMFYVRIYLLISFDFNNFKLLNHVWSSIMQSKTIFNITDSLERMVNGNKDYFTTIPTSPLFTLNPATFNPPPK